MPNGRFGTLKRRLKRLLGIPSFEPEPIPIPRPQYPDRRAGRREPVCLPPPKRRL